MPSEPENQNPVTATDTTSPPAPDQEKPLSPLLQAIKKPISTANPCGEDIGGDETFQKIKDEINKIGAVDMRPNYEREVQTARSLTTEEGRQRTRSGQIVETESTGNSMASEVNHKLVIASATQILTEKSKDLRVAVYLCLALWKTQRFAGLAEGLAVINIVVQEFGDGWFPAKTRAAARKNIVEYLTQKLGEDLSEAMVTTEDREPLKNAEMTMSALQNAFAAQVPTLETTLLGLSVAVEKCAKKVPAVKPEAPKDGEKIGDEPKKIGGGEIGAKPPAGELRSQQDAVDAVNSAAKYWRSQDRKNPAAYRLMRSIRWDTLNNDPPNTNGKTQFTGPIAQRRDHFSRLQQSGQWEKLLDECESEFLRPHLYYWLDLQKMAVTAMEALGSEYYAAKMAILQELAFLLQRAPKLPTLKFNDDGPIAVPATQSWIEEVIMPVLGGGEASVTAPSMADLEEHLASLFDEAKKLMTRGDLAAAIAHLQEGATLDTSGKNRFRRRLFMASLCLRGGQAKMARSLLEELNADVEKFSLTEWDSSLALEVWTNLRQCYESLVASAPAAGRAALQELADRTYDKMCRVDLSYALATAGTKPKTKRPVLPKPAKPRPAIADADDDEPDASAGNGKADIETINQNPRADVNPAETP